MLALNFDLLVATCGVGEDRDRIEAYSEHGAMPTVVVGAL